MPDPMYRARQEAAAFDPLEMARRVAKYAIEGLAVAAVAAVLPNSSLTGKQTVILGLTAAFVFSLLEWLAPAIAPGVRNGMGLGIGFSTVGFAL